jgi:hypothetical protein
MNALRQRAGGEGRRAVASPLRAPTVHFLFPCLAVT